MKIKKSDLKQLVKEEFNALFNEAQDPLIHQTGGGGVYGGRLRSTTPLSYKAARQPSFQTGLEFNIAKELGLIPDIETGEAFGWLQRPVSTPDSEEISHPGIVVPSEYELFGVPSTLSALETPKAPIEDPEDFPKPAPNRDDAYKAGRSMGRTIDLAMTTDPGPSPAEAGELVGQELIDLNDLLDFLAGSKEGERMPYEPTD
jgi:hypothetical protein